MAQMDIKKFWNKSTEMVKVGNNREVQWDGNNVYCYLHGYNIVSLEGNKLTLNTHGYRTTTTRNAMKDFMRVLGLFSGVSFANGRFSALGTVTDDEIITIDMEG